jgi:hypothetical protein
MNASDKFRYLSPVTVNYYAIPMAVEDSTFSSKFVNLTENYKIQQYRKKIR